MYANNLEKSMELLEQLSNIFIAFLNNLIEITETNRVNLIGVGNSISSGWTAIDNNVQPWLEKLHPFLDSKAKNKGIDLNILTFAIASDNSNERIYDFLKVNPTLEDVRINFDRTFDSWKKYFNKTPFENYVDKKIAMSFYHGGDNRLFDYYNTADFTITSFFGCTGELLQNLKKIPFKDERRKIYEKEILYLQKLIALLVNKSQHSYMTIGNFPILTKKWLVLFNVWIKEINDMLKALSDESMKTVYFEGCYLDFISRYNGKLKLDNHPSVEWQYTSLVNYLKFLMNEIPLILIKNESDKDEEKILRKYRGLDYDGKMSYRIKGIK